jgi:hypothetical protein
VTDRADRESRVEDLQRSVRRLRGTEETHEAALQELLDARDDLENFVRQDHETLRRSGLRPA